MKNWWLRTWRTSTSLTPEPKWRAGDDHQQQIIIRLTFLSVSRNVNNDVAEAMNLSALEGLEERFSHQVKVLPSASATL